MIKNKSFFVISIIFLFFAMFFVMRYEVLAESLKKPKIVSITAKSNLVNIKWKKVSGADGYIVYIKKKNGNFKKVANISGNSKTKYIAKKLKSGTEYTFKVKAKKDGRYSLASKNKTIYTLPDTPRNIKVTEVTYNTVKLKWNKVPKASGYDVYQNNGGSLELITTVDLGIKTDCVISNLKENTSYDFVVRSYMVKDGLKVRSEKSNVLTVQTQKHQHSITSGKCTSCGEITDAYAYLYDWLVKNGTVNGGYIRIDQGDYSLCYNASADYVYISSGYYNSYNDFVFTSMRLDNFEFFQSIGKNTYDDYVSGVLNPQTFTSNTPLAYTDSNFTHYGIGQVEEIRWNLCDNLNWFREFLLENNLGITLYDFGFEVY